MNRPRRSVLRAIFAIALGAIGCGPAYQRNMVYPIPREPRIRFPIRKKAKTRPPIKLPVVTQPDSLPPSRGVDVPIIAPD